jgi:hypothetical protein
VYSILLYMKTRVTFRVGPELADSLRRLPNQTQFVEAALREALRAKCPACGGTGRVDERRLVVSNFRAGKLPALERAAAQHLQQLVRLARRVAATNVDLEPTPDGGALAFVLARAGEVLLKGTLPAELERRAN